MNKKILFINAPCYNKYDDRRLPPLGILYIVSNLFKHNFICDIYDFNITYPAKSIEDFFCEKNITNYDLIAFSCVTDSFKETCDIAIKIKSIKFIPIILGGIHATWKYKEIIENFNCFDAVIRGEGEEVFVELVKDFFSNNKFNKKLSGCSYKHNNEFIISDFYCQIEHINDLPFPYREKMELYSYTIIKDKMYANIPVSTSRGCPYDCTFCSVASLKNKWRARDPKNIIDEIQLIYNQNPNIFIIFVDDNFLVNANRAIEIAKMLFEKFEINFSFATRADQVLNLGFDNLKKLKFYGCESIEIGIENGSDTFLKRIKKNVNVEQNKKALLYLKESDIFASVDYIMFDSDTTIEELYDNIDFLHSTKLFGYYPPRIYNRIIPYPGTTVEKGISSLEVFDYFHDSAVAKVYYFIDLFKKEWQIQIDKVLKEVEEKRGYKFDILYVFDILYLKCIPYIVFEKFVKSSKLTFLQLETVYKELDIEEKINEICEKHSICK